MELVLQDAAEPPIYQRIAREALHLHELGLIDCVISKNLGVNDKTVAKAVAWAKKRTSAHHGERSNGTHGHSPIESSPDD